MKSILSIPFLILALQQLAKAQDYNQYFDDCSVKGSITLYSYNDQKWYFSEEKDAEQGTLPASTFKILNSMIALETGAIKDTSEVIPWDGIEKKFKNTPIPAWNRDTNLKEAYQNSTVWFYVELARRIGKRNYKKYLRKSGYGNGLISIDQEGDFWNFGDFKVTPKEQIELLVKLHEEKLPFSERTFELVKNIMIEKQTPDYILRSKTGWTYDGFDNGWYIGYAKTKDNVWFFATRIRKGLEDDNPHFSSCRNEITIKTLTELLVK
ncbi:penicillin-binding transpeptidase domain-containing protein [Algoriphagus namhaensis]